MRKIATLIIVIILVIPQQACPMSDPLRPLAKQARQEVLVKYYAKGLMEWIDMAEPERTSSSLTSVWDGDCSMLGKKNQNGEVVTLTPRVLRKINRLAYKTESIRDRIFKEAIRNKMGIKRGSLKWEFLEAAFFLYGDESFRALEKLFVNCTDKDRWKMLRVYEKFINASIPALVDAELFIRKGTPYYDAYEYYDFSFSLVVGQLFAVAKQNNVMKDDVISFLRRQKDKMNSAFSSTLAYCCLEEGGRNSVDLAIKYYRAALNSKADSDLYVVKQLLKLVFFNPVHSENVCQVAYALRENGIWDKLADIVRDDLGGVISAKSKPGTKTRFTLRLPKHTDEVSLDRFKRVFTKGEQRPINFISLLDSYISSEYPTELSRLSVSRCEEDVFIYTTKPEKWRQLLKFILRDLLNNALDAGKTGVIEISLVASTTKGIELVILNGINQNNRKEWQMLRQQALSAASKGEIYRRKNGICGIIIPDLPLPKRAKILSVQDVQEIPIEELLFMENLTAKKGQLSARGGQGLGLLACRESAQAAGGSLVAQIADDNISFLLTLPNIIQDKKLAASNSPVELAAELIDKPLPLMEAAA